MKHFLFQTNYSKSDGKTLFVGGYIAIETIELLTLCSIANNTSKSRLLEELIYDYINNVDANQLIDNIVQKALVEYKTIKGSEKTYVKSLRKLLSQKGISVVHVNEIIKRFTVKNSER